MSTSIHTRFDSIVLGIHADGSFASSTLPTLGLSESIVSSLASAWKATGAKGSAGETRILWNHHADLPAQVALVGLGKRPKFGVGPAGSEDYLMEITRRATAIGAKAVRDNGAKTIGIDLMYSAHAAAEGSILGLYKFEQFKTLSKEPYVAPKVLPLVDTATESIPKGLNWSTGEIYAQAQNMARDLTEMPANLMTPTIFAEHVVKTFNGLSNVSVNVHDEEWAVKHKMGAFLSVSHGTEEPCKFVEISYTGASKLEGEGKDKKLAFVGKGITFDSGGISLKPGSGMKDMRGDMGGAAAVAASTFAIAKLGLPINLITVIPLTENLPSGKATKPGDIVVAMNGKTIEVDNTDAEGRLILADALYYVSSTFKPETIIDVATLTGAVMIALGDVHSGTFATDDSLYSELESAGKRMHDTFWRLPLDTDYKPQVVNTNADLCNNGGRLAGSCTAAIFLREFVDGLPKTTNPAETALEDDTADAAAIPRYAHIDIGGTMDNNGSHPPYRRKGMSGRPVRSLIEFVRNLS